MAKLLNTHNFTFNPKDNGGESLSLSTEFYDNGEAIFTNHKIALMSYGNCATISLGTVSITPEILRKLADELEAAKPKLVEVNHPKFKLGDRVAIRDKPIKIWFIDEIVLTKSDIVYYIESGGTRISCSERNLIKSNV